MADDKNSEPLPPLHEHCDGCNEVTYLGDMVWRDHYRLCIECAKDAA